MLETQPLDPTAPTRVGLYSQAAYPLPPPHAALFRTLCTGLWRSVGNGMKGALWIETHREVPRLCPGRPREEGLAPRGSAPAPHSPQPGARSWPW